MSNHFSAFKHMPKWRLFQKVVCCCKYVLF